MSTVCDICDNESETFCPHCGDDFCTACWHSIGEAHACSEAPDAQPRGWYPQQVNILVHANGMPDTATDYYVDVNECMGADDPDECLEAYVFDNAKDRDAKLSTLKLEYPNHDVTKL